MAAVVDEDLICGLGLGHQPLETGQNIGPAGQLVRGFVAPFVGCVEADIGVGQVELCLDKPGHRSDVIDTAAQIGDVWAAVVVDADKKGVELGLGGHWGLLC